MIVLAIIVTLILIIGVTITIMGSKAIASAYDNKLEDVVNQVNDAQKTAFNFSKVQERQIENHQGVISTLSQDATTLQDKNKVIDEQISGLQVSYTTYAAKNKERLDKIKADIKAMPWDQQLIQTQELQNRMKNIETNISTLEKTDIQHISELQKLTKQSFDLSNNLNSTRQTFANFQNQTNTQLYDIQGNYVKKTDMTETLKNYVTKENLDSNINQINRTLTDMSAKLQAMPSQYATSSMVVNAQNAITKAQTDLNALAGQVNTIRATYATKAELDSVRLQSSDINRGFLSTLQSLQTSMTNVQRAVAELPNQYVTKKDISSLQQAVKVTNNITSVTGNVSTTGDIIFEGGNNWIIRTPSNGQQIVIANMKNGAWDWSKSTKFDANGNMIFSNRVCIDDVCLTKDDLSKIRSSSNPINCEVAAWGSWGECSKPCGGGQQTRTRIVTKYPANGGSACPTLIETQSCNNQTCNVDCQVSSWSDWSSCSKPCGGGQRTRTRTVTQQAQNGGRACPALQEVEACNTQQCSSDCQVSAWSSWGACSAQCGGGQQTRTRSVLQQAQNGGQACPALSESQSCNTQACQQPSSPPSGYAYLFTEPNYQGTRTEVPILSMSNLQFRSYPHGKLGSMLINGQWGINIGSLSSCCYTGSMADFGKGIGGGGFAGYFQSVSQIMIYKPS
jgi:hypothetical protein